MSNYKAGSVPASPGDIPRYLEEELQRIEAAMARRFGSRYGGMVQNVNAALALTPAPQILALFNAIMAADDATSVTPGTGIIQVPESGIYQVHFGIDEIGAAPAAQFTYDLAKTDGTGTTAVVQTAWVATAGAPAHTFQLSALVGLARGDIITARAASATSSGATLADGRLHLAKVSEL